MKKIMKKVRNNSGFALIENMIAAALFAFLVLNLVLVVGQMTNSQTTYKSLTTASQIAETIAGEISVVGLGYNWLKTGITHERYFDRDGRETQNPQESKYVVRWTVTKDAPLAGMRVADFIMTWTDDQNNNRDLKFRVTR